MINWGYKFGINLTNDDNEITIIKKQLDYWIQSNKHAIETGKRLLGQNFYLLNYDSLCENPSTEIKKLMDFMEFETSDEVMELLVAIPKLSKSKGRYSKRDLSIFSPQQFEEVERLGFEINMLG